MKQELLDVFSFSDVGVDSESDDSDRLKTKHNLFLNSSVSVISVFPKYPHP